MVVSLNKGTAIQTPKKYYNLYHGDPQNGTPNFRNYPYQTEKQGLGFRELLPRHSDGF